MEAWLLYCWVLSVLVWRCRTVPVSDMTAEDNLGTSGDHFTDTDNPFYSSILAGHNYLPDGSYDDDFVDSSASVSSEVDTVSPTVSVSTTIQQPGLGDACNSSEDCHSIENGICQEKKCRCPENFYYTDSQSKCLKKPSVQLDDQVICSVSDPKSTLCVSWAVGAPLSQLNMVNYSLVLTSKGDDKVFRPIDVTKKKENDGSVEYSGMIKGLTTGTSYKVVLMAEYPLVWKTDSEEKSFCTAPEAVTVTGVARTGDQVTVTLSTFETDEVVYLSACPELTTGVKVPCQMEVARTSQVKFTGLLRGTNYTLNLITEFCHINGTQTTHSFWTLPEVYDIDVDTEGMDGMTEAFVSWCGKQGAAVDWFLLDRGDGRSLRIPAKQGQYCYNHTYTDLAPGHTYTFTVTAVLYRDGRNLTSYMDYDHTTDAARPVIREVRVVDEKTVSLLLSSTPPMTGREDEYQYAITYCTVEDPAVCQENSRRFKHNDTDPLLMSALQPFKLYNMTVKLGTFVDDDLKFNPFPASTLVNLSPNLQVAMQRWSKGAESTFPPPCKDFSPSTEACVTWRLSFTVTSALNTTVTLQPQTPTESIVLRGGTMENGEYSLKAGRLQPGVGYTVTVKVSSGQWSTQNATQIYFTHPMSPKLSQQTTANMSSVTLNLKKISAEHVDEHYEISVCPDDQQECDVKWMQPNLKEISSSSFVMTIVGLEMSTTYNMSVRSYILDTEGSRIYSTVPSSQSICTAPMKPPVPEIFEQVDKVLRFTWKKQDGVRYQLHYGGEVVEEHCSSGCTVSLDHLQPGKTYLFILYALYCMAMSEPVKVNHTLSPSNPLEGRTLNVTERSIQLEWMTQKTLVDLFYIEIYEDKMPSSTKENISFPVDPSEKSPYVFNITGLDPGKHYDFRIWSAVSITGGYKYGHQMTVLKISNSTRPYAPSDYVLLQTAPSSLKFLVTNESSADQYPVGIEPQAGTAEAQVSAYSGTQCLVAVSGLNPGVKYTIVIRAKTGVWTSPPYAVTLSTNETVPGKPGDIGRTFVNSTILRVSWSPPASPNGRLTGYDLAMWEMDSYYGEWKPYRCPVSCVLPPEQTSFTSGILTPGRCYSLSVSAENRAGVGMFTKNMTLSTPETAPSPPVISRPSSNGSHEVEIAWSQPNKPNGIVRNYTLVTRDTHGKQLCQVCFICCDCPTTACQPRNKQSECGKVKTIDRCERTEVFKQSEIALRTQVLGLHAYAHYTVSVEACTMGGCSREVVEADTRQDAPSAPRNLVATAVSSTSIYLNWSLPHDPNGVIRFYQVFYSIVKEKEKSSGQWQKMDTSSNATALLIPNLRKWTMYKFYVQGVTTTYGNRSLTVFGQTLEDVPTPPLRVKGIMLNATAVEITWSPPLEPNGIILGYEVTIYNFSNQESPWSKTVTVGGNTFSVTIPGLKYWTWYKFDMIACTRAGKSAPSGKQSIRTDEYAPTSPPDKFKATCVNATAVRLRWSAPLQPNGFITGYVITYSSGGVSGDKTLTLPKTERSVLVTELKYWTQYSFRVVAKNSKGNGPSAIDSQKTDQYVPTSPVTGVRATSSTGRSVFLDWNLPISPNGVITKYRVTYTFTKHVANSDQTITRSQDTESAEPYHNLTGLDYFWWYTVTVDVATIRGWGNVSSEPIRIQTQQGVPEAPEAFTAKPLNSTSIQLIWQPPTFPNGVITGYTIMYNQSSVSLPGDVTSAVIGDLRIWAVYDFIISAQTSAGQGKTDSILARTKEAAPLRPDSPSQPVVRPARTFTVTDPSTQAAVTLPMSFFTDGSRGQLLAWGVIVTEASTADNNDTVFEYVSGAVRCSGCTTWANYHNQGVRKPYRATDDSWTPISNTDNSGQRLRRSVNSPTVFVLGADGECGDSEICNGLLKPGVAYRVKAFVCNQGGCTDTYYSNPVITEAIPEGESPTIIGAVFGGLIALAVIAVLLYMKRTRRGPFRKRVGDDTDAVVIDVSSESSSEMELANKSRPIQLIDLEETVAKLKRSSNLGFAEEYRDLKDASPKQPHHVSELEVNRSKNRYTNILPFDHSRVKLLPLDDEEGSDYINANYIPGYNSKREYIAAQGPLPGTKDDFWRMIWEQNVSVIVMVTKCMEARGRVKCEQYWPNDDDPVYFGELIVQRRSESILPEYDIRILDIKLGREEHAIKLYNLKVWPDFGYPDNPGILLNFIRALRKEHRPSMNSPPILVHCSAGVGRTGTYIAVDCLLQQLRDQDHVDIYGRVLEMRDHRTHMVQTEDQYIYIHDCILDAYKSQHDGEENSAFEDETGVYENIEMMRSKV